jgi:CheY-like chemotaxis protein
MIEQVSSSVLVVDDDLAARLSLRAIRDRRRCEVSETLPGAGMLPTFRIGDHAATLVDRLEPDLNGSEVLWHLKALRPDLLDHIVVLAPAANADPSALDANWLHDLLHRPAVIHEVISAIAASRAERSGRKIGRTVR